MRKTILSTDLLRLALDNLRSATAQIASEAKESDQLTPALRSRLAKIQNESWILEDIVGKIENESK